MNLRVTSGSTNDKFVWRYSDIRQTMLELRTDEEVVRNEGKYYFVGMFKKECF